MTTIWSSAAVVENAATAGSGAINAAYFARRANVESGARRLGASLLALLFGATGLDAVAHLATAEASPEGALLRLPLLLAHLAVGFVIVRGAAR